MKPTDGTEYWEYILLYVDDDLCCSMNPRDVLEKELGKFWTLKKGSVGPSNNYLGNKVSELSLENGVKCWSFVAAQYVQSAAANVSRHLKEINQCLPHKATSPFTTDYWPEVDISQELCPKDASYFKSLIGILR